MAAKHKLTTEWSRVGIKNNSNRSPLQCLLELTELTGDN